MRRSGLVALLVALVLGGVLHAQRMPGNGFRGPVPGAFVRPVNPLQPHHFAQPPLLFPGGYYPFWGDGYAEPVSDVAPPMVEVRESPAPAAPVPPAPVPKAQLIEVPGPAPAVKAQSAAVFVLTSGERMEAQRYTLTSDYLFVTIARQPRRIPFAALDLNATQAANRNRGVEVKIPVDRNEVSLSF